jgi:hypothetical protein
LNFNDLKSGTTYVIELGANVMSNNGSTLGVVNKFEFTTDGNASSDGSLTGGSSPTTEPVTSEPQPETPVVTTHSRCTLSDIAEHWAKGSIEELVAMGAISGYPDGSFAPDKGISRAEFAVVLIKAFKLEPKAGKVFADTTEHWAKDSIAAANGYGIISGYRRQYIRAG